METVIKPPTFIQKVDVNVALEYLYLPSKEEEYDEEGYIFVRNFKLDGRLPGYFRFIIQDKYIESIPSPDSSLSAYRVNSKGLIKNKTLSKKLRNNFKVKEDEPLLLINSMSNRYYRLVI